LMNNHNITGTNKMFLFKAGLIRNSKILFGIVKSCNEEKADFIVINAQALYGVLQVDSLAPCL
jgi:hypothetical protein